MAVTFEEVVALLDLDEPDYAQAAQLGPDALPHLKTLVVQDEPRLASKAAYLAGLIASGDAADVVSQAAKSQHPDVRVAAAAAVRNLPADTGRQVAETLLSDQDVGVRKIALQSSATLQSPGLRARVEQMARSDPEPFLQNLARDTAEQMSP
jgi:HEAT repeat protein